jgi:hypothetical protein
MIEFLYFTHIIRVPPGCCVDIPVDYKRRFTAVNPFKVQEKDNCFLTFSGL